MVIGDMIDLKFLSLPLFSWGYFFLATMWIPNWLIKLFDSGQKETTRNDDSTNTGTSKTRIETHAHPQESNRQSVFKWN